MFTPYEVINYVLQYKVSVCHNAKMRLCSANSRQNDMRIMKQRKIHRQNRCVSTLELQCKIHRQNKCVSTLELLQTSECTEFKAHPSRKVKSVTI